MTPQPPQFEWNADALLEAFQHMVRKQDYWRGYVGDEDSDPSDEQVLQWLQEARDALREREASLSS